MASQKKSPQESLQNFAVRQGRIQHWAQVMGLQFLEDAQNRQGANEEAENKWFRRQLDADSEGGSEDEDVRTTFLGDITHPAPIIMPQQQSNLPAIAALAATLVAGGLAGYVVNGLTKDPPVPVSEAPEFDDSTVSIGLGRIEDYMEDAGQ